MQRTPTAERDLGSYTKLSHPVTHRKLDLPDVPGSAALGVLKGVETLYLPYGHIIPTYVTAAARPLRSLRLGKRPESEACDGSLHMSVTVFRPRKPRGSHNLSRGQQAYELWLYM